LKTFFWKKKSKDPDFIEDLKKNSQLKELIRYDENFNPKRKVIFESRLAGIILDHPRILFNPIKKVSSATLSDFNSIFENYINDKKNEFSKHCYEFFYHNPNIQAAYSGYYGKKLIQSKEDVTSFMDWVNNVLCSEDEETTYNKLLLILKYGHFFLRSYVHLKKFESKLDINIIPPGVGNEAIKKQMNELWSKIHIDWPSNPITHSRISTHHTARAKLTSRFGIFSDEYVSQEDYVQLALPVIPLHLPGKNVWRVTSTAEFTQSARFNLNMPLIASIGGSLGLMLIPAMVVGNLDIEEMKMFNLGATALMIGLGHHSFHEFKRVWETLSIPYTDGDYKSIFPDGLIEKHSELKSLCEEFSDLLYRDQHSGQSFRKRY
jgi:hypothetical protein